MKEIASKLAEQLQPVDFDSSLEFKFKVKRLLFIENCNITAIRYYPEVSLGEILLTVDKDSLQVWSITCQLNGDIVSVKYLQLVNRSKN